MLLAYIPGTASGRVHQHCRGNCVLYASMVSGDQQNVERFGVDYVQCMKRVTRMYFAAGLIRHTFRAKE